VWRSNLLGASGKGHEYFLKYLCGADNGVLNNDIRDEPSQKPVEVRWRDDPAVGKLDLMVTIDFRMNTTGLFSDIVLPTATWYKKNDMNTTDMHPFIHPLTAAVDPVWKARSDWDFFKSIARKFSEVADHARLALHREDERIRFRDIVTQPRKIISSPTLVGDRIGKGQLQCRLDERA
jgi:nitrate reductase alpha subunit